ncbi:MAG TPA: zinc ribbon domain-containing protein [Phycisphaerales bacterium]|nr:zinc ribbon domain-containing protein [Phycisphaerales bacterium]
MEGKICGICGENCAARPRVKDASGRYFCRSCAEGRAAGARVAAPPAREPLTLPPEIEADPYEIDPGASPVPVEMAGAVEPTRPCPVCMRSMAPGARICVSCGYDGAKGVQTSTLVEKSTRKGKRGHFCAACGYDLKGLREPVCPECGTRVSSKKVRLDEGMKAQVLSEEYLKPAVWFGIGFAIVAIALAVQGEPMGFVGYAILLAVQLPLMWIGLWLCQKTFLGDLGTPLLNLVRLAGALGLGNGVDAVIPFGFLSITPGLIVFWAVLMDLFEIDLLDAIWTGIVMALIKIAGAVLFAVALADALGLAV